MFKKQVDESEKQQPRPRPSLQPSAYTSPRPVPKVPSIASSLKSVFSSERKNKHPSLLGIGSSPSTSALSLRSAELPEASHITPIHPLSFPPSDTQTMPALPSRDPSDEEAECPVCLEPLSFSFRLPGEKPHIVPECGHALHEVPRVPIHRFSYSNLSHPLPYRHVSPQYMVLHPVLQNPGSGKPTLVFVGCVGDR